MLHYEVYSWMIPGSYYFSKIIFITDIYMLEQRRFENN